MMKVRSDIIVRSICAERDLSHWTSAVNLIVASLVDHRVG